MLSLAEYRSTLCPVCGYPKTVCQATENRDGFEVPPPYRCHAMTAISKAQNENEYEVPAALIWAAQLKPDPQP